MPRVKKLNLGERHTGKKGRPPTNKLKQLIEKKVECAEEVDNSEIELFDSQVEIKDNISLDDVKSLIDQKLKVYEEERKKLIEIRKLEKDRIANEKKAERDREKLERKKLLDIKKQEELNKQYEYINTTILKLDRASLSNKLREVKSHRVNSLNL
jgi:hypothetical protein